MTPLEALNEIKKRINPLFYDDELCEIIETALKNIDIPLTKEYLAWQYNELKKKVDELVKEHKALAIIKEKRVNLEYLKCCDTYEQYKTICSYWNEITQEEFDLLKEVFDYE